MVPLKTPIQLSELLCNHHRNNSFSLQLENMIGDDCQPRTYGGKKKKVHSIYIHNIIPCIDASSMGAYV